MTWQDNALLRDYLRQQRVGLISDMDGTVSPIVPHPSDAAPTPRHRQLLEELREHVTLLAFISGRGARDLQARIALEGLVYVGNHGLERWQDQENAVIVDPAIQPYRPQLERAITAIEALRRDNGLDAMWIEDKGATLSVHYRGMADPPQIKAAFSEAMQHIADQNALNMFHGRMIFEFRPPVAINKGTAFAQLVRDYHLDAALYIGDDTTDADALQVARTLREDGRCFGVAVGVSSGDDTPEAVLQASDLLVEGVSGAEDFFAFLLTSLKASSI